MRFIKLIDKYILKKFLVTFFAAISLIIVIVIVFDVSERLSDFIEKKAPLKAIIFDYYLNFIPYFVNDYIGLFTFISVIFFTSKLAGNTEIVAILSSGISFKRFLRPYIIGGILIALLTFFLGSFIIPHVNIKKVEFEKTYIWRTYRNSSTDIHIQLKNREQIYVQSFDNNENVAYQFTYEKLTDKGITEKISANRAIYDTVKNRWIGVEYVKRMINGLNETYEVGDTIPLNYRFKPMDLNSNMREKNISTMNLIQLHKFITIEEEKGSFLVTEYKIEYWQRLLNPLSVIIMTLIGVAVSFRKKRGGMGMNLALGILIAFTFVMLMKFTTVFSTNADLPPVISIIIPLFLYGLMAYVLIRKAPK